MQFEPDSVGFRQGCDVRVRDDPGWIWHAEGLTRLRMMDASRLWWPDP